MAGREIPGLWQAAAGALGALHSGAFGEFALLSMVLPSSAGEQLLLPRTQLALGIFCVETRGAGLPLHPCSRFPNGIHFTAFPAISFPKAGSAPPAAPFQSQSQGSSHPQRSFQGCSSHAVTSWNAARRLPAIPAGLTPSSFCHQEIIVPDNALKQLLFQ